MPVSHRHLHTPLALPPVSPVKLRSASEGGCGSPRGVAWPMGRLRRSDFLLGRRVMTMRGAPS